MVVFPAPAAPSTTSSWSWPASAATTSRCPASNPAPARSSPISAPRWAVAGTFPVTPPGTSSRMFSGRVPASVVERPMNRATRSASTARTSGQDRARMCSGRPRRPTSGTQPARARAVRSSARSERAGAPVTIPLAAIHCSTCPRTSAAFHPERVAPNRVRTSRAAPSRSTAPTRTGSAAAAGNASEVPAGVGERSGARYPRLTSSSTQRRSRSAPSVGTTLSGRSWAHAWASQARRSRVPGSTPGCTVRQVASYRSTWRPIWAARALNGPTNLASCTISPVSRARVNPRPVSAALKSGSHITAACPMPLTAARLSRTPTVCRPRHVSSARTRAFTCR